MLLYQGGIHVASSVALRCWNCSDWCPEKTRNIFDIKDFKETYAPFQPSILQPSFVNLKDEGFTEPDLRDVVAKMEEEDNIFVYEFKSLKYAQISQKWPALPAP